MNATQKAFHRIMRKAGPWKQKGFELTGVHVEEGNGKVVLEMRNAAGHDTVVHSKELPLNLMRSVYNKFDQAIKRKEL